MTISVKNKGKMRVTLWLRELGSSNLIGFITAIFLCSFFTYCFFYGERIPVNEGLGWDGKAYASWAQGETLSLLKEKTLGKYYVGRILPSLIVNLAAKFLSIDLTQTANVIKSFFAFNLLMVWCGIFFFFKIALFLKWDLRLKCLGFAMIFLNYSVLVNLSYNPTILDWSALGLGVSCLYFGLVKNTKALWFTSLLGAFVWPTLIYFALPLLVYGETPMPEVKWPKINRFLALCIALIVTATVLGFYFISGVRLPYGANQVNEHLILISSLILLGYLYFTLSQVIDISIVRALFSKKLFKRYLSAIILIILIKIITQKFSDGTEGAITSFWYLVWSAQTSIVNPGSNVVAHISYFGPGFVLLIIFWKSIVNLLRRQSLGMWIGLSFFVYLSIDSESRHLINVWPVFVVLLCELFRKRGVSWPFVISIITLNLVLSRFWLPQNLGPWDEKFLEFPMQMFFMSIGPWMSHQMYWVWLGISILVFVAVFALVRAEKHLEWTIDDTVE